LSGRWRRRAKHGFVYPPEERGRRIVWRTVTVGVYLVLTAAAIWVAHVQGWSDGWFPPRGLLGLVGLPYWAVVTAVWKRYGPYMPRLHGNGRPPKDPRMR
jgi:hypothetical protein